MRLLVVVVVVVVRILLLPVQVLLPSIPLIIHPHLLPSRNKYAFLFTSFFKSFISLFFFKKTEQTTTSSIAEIQNQNQRCLGCNATSTPEWRRGPMG